MSSGSRIQRFLRVLVLATPILFGCRKDATKSADHPVAPTNEVSAPAPQPSSPRRDVVATTTAQASPADKKGAIAKRKASRGEKLAAVEAELLSKWDEIRSLSVKLETFHEIEKSPKIKEKGAGTRDCAKRDGKLLIRTQFVNQILMENPDPKEDEPPWYMAGEHMVKVSDGVVVYTLRERNTIKTVTKSWARRTPFQYLGGPGLVASLHSLLKLQRKPDEQIGGKPVYVFEGYLQDRKTVRRIYIDQETGLLRRITSEDKAATDTRKFEFTEITVNPDFPEGHFKFVPPSDAEFIDQTGAQTKTDLGVPEPPPARP